jgi:hypothetical protein
MKTWMIALGALGIAAVFALIVVVYVISTLNNENRIRQAVIAKQRDNTSEMDNMWKKISQVAQVTEGQKNALVEIFNGYAQARSGKGGGGSLATWIHESVPNVDTKTFENLQNIITGSRDRWTMQQKELIDLKREDDTILTTIPSGWICSMFGRTSIDITIVTSSRTEEAFKSGRDDDTQVFPQKKAEK